MDDDRDMESDIDIPTEGLPSYDIEESDGGEPISPVGKSGDNHVDSDPALPDFLWPVGSTLQQSE
jgi:hypothetical protein